MAFVKIFQDLLMSTVWRESQETRLLWITMLVSADFQGRVMASVPGLADAAKISLEGCEKGLEALSSPDPYSRTQEHGGRRIEKIDGGWRVLNYPKYRSRRDRSEYMREYMRAKRNVSHVSHGSKTFVAHTDTDTDTDKRILFPKGNSATESLLHPVAEYWNSFSVLPSIRKLNPSRARKLKLRMQDPDFAANWEAVICRIAKTPFLLGHNDQGWKASFDWLIANDANYLKVLEGKYDHDSPLAPKDQQDKLAQERINRLFGRANGTA